MVSRQRRQPYSVAFFFSSRRRHTRFDCDWSSDVCSSDLAVSCLHHGSAALMEIRMKRHFALAFLPLLIASAFADVSPPSQDAQKQPRTLGQKAVLHIYYYAPKTLEITYVDSYLFKDESACENAVSAALKIAMPYEI